MAGRHRRRPAAQAVLVSDGEGGWTVDGETAPHSSTGSIDVDLEASGVHEHAAGAPADGMPLGEVVEAPAAYVRALDLAVVRLDQTYRRPRRTVASTTPRRPTSRAVLEYDAAGLIVDYPGIATRFA